MVLLVREQDIGRVQALLREEWDAMLATEGVVSSAADVDLEAGPDEPPCPACGTAAPLVEGACADCGLQLA